MKHICLELYIESYTVIGHNHSITFMKVVVFTILEMDTGDDQTRPINHHGAVRKVFDAKMPGVTNKENGFMLPKKNLGHIAKFFRKYLYRTHKNRILTILIVSLESRVLPTFVLIFSFSYFVIACFIYFNI